MLRDLAGFLPLAVFSNTAAGPPFEPILLWFASRHPGQASWVFFLAGALSAGLAGALEALAVRAAAGTGRPRAHFHALVAALAFSPLPFTLVRVLAARQRPQPLPYALAIAVGRLPRYALTVLLWQRAAAAWGMAFVLAAALLLPPRAESAEHRQVPVGRGETLHAIVERAPGRPAQPPVVLVPALLGSAYGYRQVLPLFAAAGHPVVVLEPLGVGASPSPEGADYSLTAQADRIAAAMKALELEPAIVVGHAVAASIALRVAYRHPARVAAVVSLEGGLAEAAATPSFRRALRFAPLLRLFGIGRLRATVRRTLQERSADPRWVTEEALDGYLSREADVATILRTYGQIARAEEPEPLGPHLHEVRCPVRLLVGAVPHEGSVRPEHLATLRAQVPAFEVVTLPGVGHFGHEEAPAALVAALRASLAPPLMARTASP